MNARTSLPDLSLRAVDSVSTLQRQAMIDHPACGVVGCDAQDQRVGALARRWADVAPSFPDIARA